jgi:type IV pilus assembly protein PilW
MQLLGDDLRLAGYLAEFDIGQATLPGLITKPDPCLTAPADLQKAVALHVQGYDGGATLSCLNDVKAGTDIVVIRRAATCISGAANCPAVAGAPYFQASLCNSATQLNSLDVYDQFRLDTATVNLNRTRKDCTALSDMRRYLVRIYFVANNDTPGDGIPTLKRAELGAAGFTIEPVSEGVEDLQLEYGVDSDGDSVPNFVTADPDLGAVCPGPTCLKNWTDTTMVRVNLLVRNTTTTGQGYTDSKTYNLGLKSDGTPYTVTPGGAYRRHAYQADFRLNNPAGRREP